MDVKFTSAELREWASALKSGKYEQGRGQLYSRNTDDYCCLGVLAAAKGVPFDGVEHFAFPGPSGVCLSSCFLAGYLGEKFGDNGIEVVKRGDDLGVQRPLRVGSTLIEWNDSRGVSFAEIAEYLNKVADAMDAAGM